MKLDCSVIQDLLPLYIDDVSSEASSRLVAEHLKSCEDCKKVYQEMTGDEKPASSHLEEKEIVSKAAKQWKNERKRLIKKIIAITVFSCIAIYIALYAYLGYKIFSVDHITLQEIEHIQEGVSKSGTPYIELSFKTRIPKSCLGPEIHSHSPRSDIKINDAFFVSIACGDHIKLTKKPYVFKARLYRYKRGENGWGFSTVDPAKYSKEEFNELLEDKTFYIDEDDPFTNKLVYWDENLETQVIWEAE